MVNLFLKMLIFLLGVLMCYILHWYLPTYVFMYAVVVHILMLLLFFSFFFVSAFKAKIDYSRTNHLIFFSGYVIYFVYLIFCHQINGWNQISTKYIDNNGYVIIEKNGLYKVRKEQIGKLIDGKIIAKTDLEDNRPFSCVSQIEINKNFANIKSEGTIEIVYAPEWGHMIYGPPENLARKDSIDLLVNKTLKQEIQKRLSLGIILPIQIMIGPDKLPKEVLSVYFTGNNVII